MTRPPHTDPRMREIADRVTKELVDKGLIIAGGWAGFSTLLIPKGAPQIQIDEMQKAFFAGASHLFASILTMLDPDEEATEDDLQRLDNIAAELDAFETKLITELETKGNA